MTTPPDNARPRPASLNAPLSLGASDFESYLPERATSNAYTRARLELKQRMLAWAKAIVSRLGELGIAVDVTGSDEHPNVRNNRRVECQRIFFWRGPEARAELERLIDRKRTLAAALGDPSPHKSHAYLGLKIDSTHVDVSIEVHAEAWVDLRNLRARVDDAGRALELTTALEALPEQYAIGLATDANPAPANGIGTDAIRALLDRCESERAPLWLGWRVPRELAVQHAELLADQLGDAIVALGPVYKLLAWAPDNDLLVLDREWDAARAEKAKAHAEAERERAEWESKREGERRVKKEKPERRPRHREEERSQQGRGVAPAQREPAAPALPKRAPLPARARPVSRQARVTEIDPSAPIEKGTKVQVMAGPFAGKLGVVQELDGKGGARVMLGLLALRLEVKDLVASAEGRDRPALTSSHRRPIPARS
jgi:transcription antitermination factor NusG